jgi:hypothetical protein
VRRAGILALALVASLGAAAPATAARVILTRLPAATTGAGPAGSAVGDVTGDGNADVVVANVIGGTVSVLHGNGDGTLQP